MAIEINIPSQVKTFANLAAFPATGAVKTIYIAEDTNKTYRWTGSVYVEISASAAAATWGNITGTLSNQTDLQNALNAKENTITAGTTSQYFRGDKTFQTLDKAAVGLGNVDNTSDANKPISTATQTALNAKQDTLTLTTTGTSGAATLIGSTLNIPQYSGGSSSLTIGTTAIASGVAGRILFEGTGNVLQESANLFWDNTNAILDISASIRLSGTGGVATYQSLTNISAFRSPVSHRFQVGAGNTNMLSIASIGVSIGQLASNARLHVVGSGTTSSTTAFLVQNSSSTTMMQLNDNGNLLINTTTDAGFRLDVNGTARFSGQVTFANNSNINASGNLSIGAFSFHSAFGYSTFAPNTTLPITTSTFNATSGSLIGLSLGTTFSPTSGTATFSSYAVTPTINQTGGANGITRGLYINPTLTAAADFRAIETARGNVVFGNLPTSAAGLPTGAIYNNLGVLMIV